jgi:hypothetical protein
MYIIYNTFVHSLSVTGHNAKYNMHIASNPDISNRVNVADDILAVLIKFNDSSFIREVITTNPQQTPSVICYTDEQKNTAFVSPREHPNHVILFL